jgi:hypothetical protein
VTLLAQEIGRGDAEQTGAQNDDFHEEYLHGQGTRTTTKRWWFVGRSPCPWYLRDSTRSAAASFAPSALHAHVAREVSPDGDGDVQYGT